MKRNKAETTNQKRLKHKIIRHIDFKWIFLITILSFFISVVFSAVSSEALKNVNNLLAFLILLIFILIGIIFDVIGVAATSGTEKQFHSMASKKVRGALDAVWIIRNAEKVSSFCNDVVGDISGIISGATGAIIISRLTTGLTIKDFVIGLCITGIIASLTIGGKAIGKSMGMNYSSNIIFWVAGIMNIFTRK